MNQQRRTFDTFGYKSMEEMVSKEQVSLDCFVPRNDRYDRIQIPAYAGMTEALDSGKITEEYETGSEAVQSKAWG